MTNLRFKWVGRWSPRERKLRLFRVMWETSREGRLVSHKLSVSICRWLPRVKLHHSYGGIYV